jgi:S1-C subfamily serine protease
VDNEREDTTVTAPGVPDAPAMPDAPATTVSTGPPLDRVEVAEEAPPTTQEPDTTRRIPFPFPIPALTAPAIPGWEIPGPTVVPGPSYAYGTPGPGERTPGPGEGPPGKPADGAESGTTAIDDEAHRTGRGRRWVVVAVVAALVGGAVGAATAVALDGADGSGVATNTVREVAPGPALSGGASIPAVVQKVAPQVVSIDATGSGGASGSFEDQGTGLILSGGGEVLTNNHVIAGASAITVTLYGKTTPLATTVVGTDPAHDLALLKITSPPAALQPVSFGDSTQLQVGDAVIAIGNALGLSAQSPTVTSGIVSALGRTVQAGDVGGGQVENLTNMIQTDAAINSGNSGGALVDSVGQVIGMNTAVASSSVNNAPAQNIGFAIPSSTIEGLLPTLRAGGTQVAHRAYLGVEVEDLTAQLKQAYNFVPSTGAVVVRVVSASPAAAAGIQQGDVIVGFGARTVDSAAALTTAVQASKPGEKVRITLWRGQQKLTVTATLGSTAGG